MVSRDTFYQKSSDYAMHYNLKIWTVFSVGVAFSLIILSYVWFREPLNYDSTINIFLLFLGYLVLIYCSLAIESFGQKKRLYEKIKNRFILNGEGNSLEEGLINSLPSKGILKCWEVPILSLIFIIYIISFILFGKDFPLLTGFIILLMIVGYFYVFYQWIKRLNFDEDSLNPRIDNLVAQTI